MSFTLTHAPKCAHCAKVPVLGSSWPLIAVAVPSDEIGADHLYELRVALGAHGVAATGPGAVTFDDIEALVAADSTDDDPIATWTDDASVLVFDPKAEPRDVLASVGELLAKAREDARIATEAAKSAVRFAVATGMSEAEAARVADVDRMTVRAWLGK